MCLNFVAYWNLMNFVQDISCRFFSFKTHSFLFLLPHGDIIPPDPGHGSQLEESVPSGTVPSHIFSFWGSFDIPKHLSTKETCHLPEVLWSGAKRDPLLSFNTYTQQTRVIVRIHSFWLICLFVTSDSCLYICRVPKFLSCTKTLAHKSKLLGKSFQANLLPRAGTLSESLLFKGEYH